MCFEGGVALESTLNGGWDLMLSKLTCLKIAYPTFKSNNEMLLMNLFVIFHISNCTIYSVINLHLCFFLFILHSKVVFCHV